VKVICLIGAGRIGAIHGANVAAHPGAELRYVVDVNAVAASSLAQSLGAQEASLEQALADPGLDAVLVATATPTHVDMILAATRAGKAVFCEKPIDLSAERVQDCLKEVSVAHGFLMLGFNRRFDPHFSALQDKLRAGLIGDLEMVSIVSRDPAPPPLDYIRQSGGLFLDMMIHDFDMARWLLGEEPCEVYASASCLVDQAIAEAGDVDSALVVMRTPTGRLCTISNSRRAVYGYDQRVEVLGSLGMLRVENETPTRLQHYSGSGASADNLLHFFLERYRSAYRLELDSFISALTTGAAPPVSGDDGWRAQQLAAAADQSLRQKTPVQVG